MGINNVIDVHCHMFNAKFVIMELITVTWNFTWGNYPYAKGMDRNFLDNTNIATLGGVREFAAWGARLIDASILDCQGNYNTELKEFNSSKMGKDASLVVTPLMVDLYFALDENKSQYSPDRFTINQEHKNGFELHINRIKKLVIEELQKLQENQPKVINEGILTTIAMESIFRDFYEIINHEFNYNGIELSPGYEMHMKELEKLSKGNPGKVFPFLAVDPRRLGIIKLIDLKINKGKGIFRGIKLYPPLGYLPTHPGLVQIFDYCTKYDIPVTTHCSEGGIANFRKENYVVSWDRENLLIDFNSLGKSKSSFYAAPENWIPVLKRWPTLRLNFAHFGGSDNWMESIIGIMEKYENVYTDISYLRNIHLHLIDA